MPGTRSVALISLHFLSRVHVALGSSEAWMGQKIESKFFESKHNLRLRKSEKDLIGEKNTLLYFAKRWCQLLSWFHKMKYSHLSTAEKNTHIDVFFDDGLDNRATQSIIGIGAVTCFILLSMSTHFR